MRLTLSITLETDVDQPELELIKDSIQDLVENHDSGAVVEARWVNKIHLEVGDDSH
jgi:hypothetical protein